MPIEPAALVALLLLGGWVGADATSLGQFMVSRPLVAGALAGWVVGAPVEGTVIGAVLEAFHLAVLPVGAARYPEGGPPTVVSAAMYGTHAELPGALLICVVFALAWDWVSGETVRILRQLNVQIVRPVSTGDAGTLQRRHLASLGLDALRGVILVGVGLVALLALLRVSADQWGVDVATERLAVGASVAGLLASTARFFGTRTRLFVAGALAGLLFLWAGR